MNFLIQFKYKLFVNIGLSGINKKNIVMYMERLNGTLKWKGE